MLTKANSFFSPLRWAHGMDAEEVPDQGKQKQQKEGGVIKRCSTRELLDMPLEHMFDKVHAPDTTMMELRDIAHFLLRIQFGQKYALWRLEHKMAVSAEND